MVNPIESIKSGRGSFRPFCFGSHDAPHCTLRESHSRITFLALDVQDFFFRPIECSVTGRNQGHFNRARLPARSETGAPPWSGREVGYATFFIRNFGGTLQLVTWRSDCSRIRRRAREVVGVAQVRANFGEIPPPEQGVQK